MKSLLRLPDREDFLSNYLEKRPLLLKSAALEIPFLLADLESILHAINAQPPRVNVFLKGVIHWSYYAQSRGDPDIASEFRFDPGKLQALLRQGATLSLNKIHRLSPAIAAQCGEVSALLGQSPVTANGYLCMGGDGSFGAHWDTHDVFAVQLIGRKRWQIFEPTHVLPLDFETSQTQKAKRPAMPIMDLTLERGDILYLPRGWWHDTEPLPGTSFHVAIGVHPPKVIDYATWVCTQKLPDYLVARKSFQKENNLNDLGKTLADLIVNAEIQSEYLLLTQKKRRSNSSFDLSYLISPNEMRGGNLSLYLNSTYFQINEAAAIVNGNIIGIDKEACDILKVVEKHPGILMTELSAKLDGGDREINMYLTDLVNVDILNTGVPGITGRADHIK